MLELNEIGEHEEKPYRSPFDVFSRIAEIIRAISVGWRERGKLSRECVLIRISIEAEDVEREFFV